MSKQRSRSLNRAALRRARKLMRGGVAVGLVAAGACSDGGAGPSAANTGSGGSDATNAGSGGMHATGSGGTQSTNPSGGFAPPPMMPSGFPGMGFAGSGVVGVVPTRPQPAGAGTILYSWTSDKQIEELRAKPVLLTRSESSDGTQTRLSVVISALADQGNALATVLTGGAFVKGRYAWTNAWATLRGWPGESYGDQLLRIELQPESWIVELNQDTLTVMDIKGNSVPTGAALGTPERIAAVYYVNEGDGNGVACGGSFQSGCATGTYREYFINNEKMVKAWSFGTQEILDELQRSIDFLKAMRDQSAMGGAPTDPCDFSTAALCTWQDAFPLGGTFSDYMTGLAITSDYYVPTSANLDELIKALQDAQFEPDDPVMHEP